jgi:hypothetical protein
MEAADELRRLSGSLHPVALEQSGLVQALAALTETLQDEHGVAAQLTAPAERSSRDNAHDAAVYMIARGDRGQRRPGRSHVRGDRADPGPSLAAAADRDPRRRRP